jgi:hypothetical protein
LLYNSGVTSDTTKIAHTFTSSANSNIMTMTYGGNVGIGTSNPSAIISSSKILQLSSTGNTTLSVRSTDGVNDRNAILELLSSGNGNSKSIILYGDTDTTPSSESPLVIQKYHSGSRTEVGRFNTSGHLVLGAATTAYYRLKSGATGTDGGIQWMFNSDATVYASLTLPYDTRGTTGLHLYSGYPITHTVPVNKAHQFVTGSTEAARIDADGIKFNGDTAATNALDDYEEGTWTPVFTGSTSGTLNGVGSYTKVGRLVTVKIHFSSSIPSGTLQGNVSVTGFPFAAIDTFTYGLLHIRAATTTGPSGAPFGLLNSTTLRLHNPGNLGNTNAFSTQPPTFPASGIYQNGVSSVIIDWGFTYYTA